MKVSKSFLLVILICFLATEYNGQDLTAEKLAALRPAAVTITAYGTDGTVIRQGGGFFINAEGEVATSRQVFLDAVRAEINTSDNQVYPVQVVNGEDGRTGILKLAAENIQGKVSFMPISNDEVKDGEVVFVLSDKGTTKLTEGTTLSRIEVPGLGQFFKLTESLPLSRSGNPVVNSEGEVIGVVVIENLAGQQAAFVAPAGKILSLKAATQSPTVFARWAEGNTSERLTSASGLYYKGLVLLVTKGCDSALPIFEAALEEDTSNAQVLLLAGRCMAQSAHAQKAIEYYRRALRNKPDFAEAHFELANSYIEAYGILGSETYRTAIEAYKKAIAIKPDFVDAYFNLSGAYRKVGLVNDEIQTYQRIIKLKPGLAKAHVNLGTAYKRAGKFQEEINEYLLASKLDPSLVEPVYNIGNAYLRLRRTNLAAKKYKEALRLDPDLAVAHMGLGEAYLREGHEDRAVREYRKAVSIEPSAAIAHLNLGTSYLYADKNREAINSLARALQLSPDLDEAAINLALAYQRLNEPLKAQELLARFPDAKDRASRLGSSPERIEVVSSEPLVSKIGAVAEVATSTPNFMMVTTPSSAPEAQQPLEKLFTASWFTQGTSSPTTNDFASAAERFLRVGTPYLLKFALQDTAFVTTTGGPGSTTQIASPPSDSLEPGTEMEVTYYSAGLEPERGTKRMVTPKRGETSVVAFSVSPTSSDLKGVPVWMELRVKGLAFHTATLTPTVVPRSADSPSEPELEVPTAPANKTTESSAINSASRKAYEPLRQDDVEITIMPNGNDPYNIEIDWKGHPDILVSRTGLTPTGLDETLEGFRNDLKTELESKEFMGDRGSRLRLIDTLVMEKNVRQYLVWRLARLGHRLYRELFTDDKLRQRLAEIRAFAQANPGKRLRVQIKNRIGPDSSSRLLLPFGLLYDGAGVTEDTNDASKADVKNFWDYRYQIEFVESRSVYRKSTLCEEGRMRLAAVMDLDLKEGSAEAWQNEIETQRIALSALQDQRKIVFRPVPNEDAFMDIFRGKEAPLDLIYYYGHTSNSRPPAFTLTTRSRSTNEIRDAATDQENRLRQLQDHPFVFLNSCKGVAFGGRSQNTFLNVLNDLGASGFIGTETSMRIPYAAAIGKEFLERITGGKRSIPVVQALWEMKHDALATEDGNPLIMLYSVYGDPYVRTCASK